MGGNHPQLGDALANVRALQEAYAAHQRERLDGHERTDDEERRRRKKREKKSRRREEKKRKSEKRRKRRREGERDDGRARSGSESESSSRSDWESASGKTRARRGAREIVARGRNACEALRHLLAKFPSERDGFRELLRTVDGGKGVATAGVADATVRRYLEYFFDNASLRRSSRTGAWTLDEGDVSLMSRFGGVFDESIENLRVLENAREPWLGPDPAVVEEERARKEERAARRAASGGPETETRVLTGDEAHAFMAARESDSDDGAREPTPTMNIGPAAGPPPQVDAERPAPAPAKRVLGPMVPPKSMLEAAAAELEFDSTFGPPPPELIAELENIADESREACAQRIVRIMRRGGDAYDILGVTLEDTSSVIKKKYWKLSLMVHPDKCSHEDAKNAFDAIKKAHSALSDEHERALIDQKRNAANEREEFEAWLAGEREKAAWRRMQGKPLPGDDELLDGAKKEGDTREEWMTHLPPEKRPNQGPPTVSVTHFSKSEKVARTAEMEAAWTDTPQQAAAREKQLFLQAQEQQYVLPAAVENQDRAKQMVDEYNATCRTKSLVEIHQERQREDSKEKKAKKEKKEKKDKNDKGPGDGTNWEYRPFDRDTDLKLKKPGQLKPEEMLKRAGGGLGDRFRN
ncbi:Protein of unknown function DUF3752 [Ostreococcus tauri]|uniref:J domain-containing protein n=1 Tax=Ostreococcus tauri TaxID=70448 RepID=A0A090LY43_OSTTA|nr:Protein of unknown function DUF3752 [Ostreococcus tauri]CEF96785.1 Protein of unknown function DUF3752 [Ostreococcus tauri]|eukprot:XP_003074505.2 Protein of unknown function DUF3752 [Ostreococcus tauri]